MSRRLKFAIGLAAVVVAGLVVFVVSRAPAGAGSPESAVDEYLAALDARDRDRLERLADPENDAAGEITGRLERLGGGRLVAAGSRVTGTESAFTKVADISGSIGGAPYADRLWLHAGAASWPHSGIRWFVVLGPNRNAHPKGAST
ncbi:hypothetical protein ACQP00_29320 [Dactylosporangium sp. CS-047395]|uniref:hypothetical protein n=1 Tax=Dactylosporangium sp. CS-047395 TaxID=3239936 RepID=UPI003D8DDD20